MILLAVVLLALFAIPLVIGQRARVEAMTAMQLVVLWAIALVPLALSWWLMTLAGHGWAIPIGGPEWLGPALLIVVFLVIPLLVVSLPVAAATATILWAIARRRRPRADQASRSPPRSEPPESAP